jgi:MFS family permease
VSYGPAIYASLGFTTVAQLCITAGYVTWGCLCGFIGTLLVDRVGRVKMMKIGVVMQILLMGVVTALVAVYAGGANKAANTATVVIIYIFEAGYTLFLEGPTYTYVSEMWPVNLRAKGCALGVASLYLIDIVYVE